MAFRVQVLAFDEGGSIPKRYSGEGEDVSPAIEWGDLPAGTRSLALVVDDPDAPAGTWTHWLLCDIPTTETALPEGFRCGTFGHCGVNDFGNTGYGGPMPPRGHGPHRYFFRLYALDMRSLILKDGYTRAQFERAMRGHDLAEVHFMGRYERA